MKKSYISPEFEFWEIEISDSLTGSVGDYGGGGDWGGGEEDTRPPRTNNAINGNGLELF